MGQKMRAGALLVRLVLVFSFPFVLLLWLAPSGFILLDDDGCHAARMIILYYMTRCP